MLSVGGGFQEVKVEVGHVVDMCLMQIRFLEAADINMPVRELLGKIGQLVA